MIRRQQACKSHKLDEALAKDYLAIFIKAYEHMNQPVVEGNCGELCGYHCCRPSGIGGDPLGMYLLPLEFEYMQDVQGADYEIHRCQRYEMPPQIKKMVYLYCGEAEGCLRDRRPIQCRTYPFEPHFEGDELSLVIEGDQIHDCPLLNDISKWRPEFMEGIYKGWNELLKISNIRYFVRFYSRERIIKNNIAKQYTKNGWAKG